jgi:hypothetical protein
VDIEANMPGNNDDHSAQTKAQLLEEKKRQLAALEEEDELIEIELQLAQKKKDLEEKRARVEALQAGRTATDGNHVAATPHQSNPQEQLTIGSLANDKELQAAVEVLKQIHLPDMLSQNTTGADETSTKSGKSLLRLIPDYVIKPNASTRDREHHLGRGLVIREGKSRIRPEDVSESQWAGATLRILAEMMDYMDKDEVRKYLEYNIQIADYLQVCKTPTVMLLDDEHRRRVQKGLCQWNEVDHQKAYFFLDKKEEEPKGKKTLATIRPAPK